MTFPTILDSTMLNDFRECPQRFYWNWIRRIRPPGTSIHLVAGGAFASGLERARHAFYVDGLAPLQAIESGLDSLLKAYTIHEVTDKKPIDLVATAFLKYFERWPLDSDYLKPAIYAGKPCIEFNFAIPLPINHPETGEPLLFTGRCDMIATYRDQAEFVVDEKTQSQLGDKWSEKWLMRAQFTAYTWAAREHGYRVTGTIVRGIRLTTNIDFAEAIIHQQPWKVDRWYAQTLRDVNEMIELWHLQKENAPIANGNVVWPYALGDPCSAYGGCPYLKLCDSEHPDRWIEGNYVPNTWNPLTREG